jgi:hypothetical protein
MATMPLVEVAAAVHVPELPWRSALLVEPNNKEATAWLNKSGSTRVQCLHQEKSHILSSVKCIFPKRYISKLQIKMIKIEESYTEVFQALSQSIC